MGFSFFSAPSPAFNLTDKVVIVTGASSGIGKALALKLANDYAGTKVVLAARRADQLQAVAKELGNNNNCLVVPTDVSKKEDCQNLIQQTIETYGRLDVVVCNAGISQTTRLDDVASSSTNLQYYHDMMDTNYFGTVHCVYHALPHLKQSSGMIVAVSSMCGKLGVPTRTGYCASKHAVHGFLDALRTELMMSEDNVSILLACPGYVKTEIRSIASGNKPDDINETGIMTVEECVDIICKGMEQKKREIYVVDSLLASWSPYIRMFLPEFADRIIVEKQKGGRT